MPLDGKSNSSRTSSPRDKSQLSSPDTSTDDSCTLEPPIAVRSPPDGGESSSPDSQKHSPEKDLVNNPKNIPQSKNGARPKSRLESLFIPPDHLVTKSTDIYDKPEERTETDNDVDSSKASDSIGHSSSVEKTSGSVHLVPITKEIVDNTKEVTGSEIDSSKASDSIDHSSSFERKSDSPNDNSPKDNIVDSRESNISSAVTEEVPSIGDSNVVNNTSDTSKAHGDHLTARKPNDKSLPETKNEGDTEESDIMVTCIDMEPEDSDNLKPKTEDLKPTSDIGNQNGESVQKTSESISAISDSAKAVDILSNNKFNKSDKETPKKDQEKSDVSKIDTPNCMLVSIKPLTATSIHKKAETKDGVIDKSKTNSANKDKVHSTASNEEKVGVKTADTKSAISSRTAQSKVMPNSPAKSSLLQSPKLKLNNKMNMFLRDDSKFKVPELKVGSPNKNTVLSKPNSASRLKGLHLPSRKTTESSPNKPALSKLPKLGALVLASSIMLDSTKTKGGDSKTLVEKPESHCRNDTDNTSSESVSQEEIKSPPDSKQDEKFVSSSLSSSSFLRLKKFQPMKMTTTQSSSEVENSSSTSKSSNENVLSSSPKSRNISGYSIPVKRSNEVTNTNSSSVTPHKKTLSSSEVKVNIEPATPGVDLTHSSSSEGLSLSSASEVFGSSVGSHLLHTPRSKRLWSLTSNSDVDSLHQSMSASMASVVSLISQDELAELLEEANKTLDDTGADDQTPINVVVLHKQAHEKLGIRLAAAENGGFTVASVEPNSIAHIKHVHVGHFLLSVNGVTLGGMKLSQAEKTLSTSREQVVLVFTPQANDDKTSKSAENNTETLNDSSSTFAESKSPSTESDTVMVDLMKGKTGLGFCLDGGKESPLGPRPITVKRIFKGSIPVLKNILSIGDEIVCANDVDFSSFTHHQAWNFLKSQPEGVIKLELRRADNN